MSKSQRILKSQRQPQADRGNRINLFSGKVFTLHLSLRNAPIPLGQKGVLETYCERSRQRGVIFKSLP